MMNPIESADALAAFLATLPEGVDYMGFMVIRTGDRYAATAVGTCAPQDVLPAIRDWIRRVEAGEDGTVNLTEPLQ